jgi:branched-subunit amino acid transport protein AzlD
MATSGLAEGTTSFGQLMQNLEGIGFFTGLLPFVITYAIFFFLLRKVGEEILNEDTGRPQQFAAILSIAFAFFTSRFILINPVYQQFFTQYLGRFTVLAVGLLGLLVILGWLGIEVTNLGNGLWGAIAALLILAVFVVSGGLRSSLAPLESQNEILNAILGFISYSISSGIIFIFLIIGLLAFTFRDPTDSSGDDSLLETLFNANPDSGSGSDN